MHFFFYNSLRGLNVMSGQYADEQQRENNNNPTLKKAHKQISKHTKKGFKY